MPWNHRVDRAVGLEYGIAESFGEKKRLESSSFDSHPMNDKHGSRSMVELDASPSLYARVLCTN